MTQVDVLA